MFDIHQLENNNKVLSSIYLFYFLYKNGFVKSSSIDLTTIESEASTKLRRKVSFYLKGICEKLIEENNLSSLFPSVSINYNHIMFNSVGNEIEFSRWGASASQHSRNTNYFCDKIKDVIGSEINYEFLGIDRNHGGVRSTDDFPFHIDAHYQQYGRRSRSTWAGKLGFGLTINFSGNTKLNEREFSTEVEDSYDKYVQDNNLQKSDVDIMDFVDSHIFKNIKLFFSCALDSPKVALETMRRIKYIHDNVLNGTYDNLNDNHRIRLYDLSLIPSAINIVQIRRYNQNNNQEKFRIIERLYNLMMLAYDMRKDGRLNLPEVDTMQFQNSQYLLHDIVVISHLMERGTTSFGIYEDRFTVISEMTEFFVNALEQNNEQN